MGTVSPLPSAAAAKVRQPAYSKRYALRRKGVKAGKLAILPVEHMSAEVRAYLAERAAEKEARQALYAAGGLTRNAPYFLIAAMFGSLTPEAQANTLQTLEALAKLDALSPDTDPAPTAAAVALIRTLTELAKS